MVASPFQPDMRKESAPSTTGLVIDPPTGVIDLAASTPGIYTVTYTVPDSLGCAEYSNTATVDITEAPLQAVCPLVMTTALIVRMPVSPLLMPMEQAGAYIPPPKINA